ncbi:MAG: nucleoside deaminase [Puniceicoccales bacterium]|nr:nucleoside deaminase [Puniceicoccales bacterium]
MSAETMDTETPSDGDIFCMELAIDAAELAFQEDEVPVGAVIFSGEKVLAIDHNRVRSRGDPTAHGEMLVLRAAAAAIGDWRLSQCVLYTTKEPCPMCAGACIMARIGRVVIGVGDPAMGCFGGGPHDFSQTKGFHHHPIVLRGVLSQRCLEILRRFFVAKRQPRPPCEGGRTDIGQEI